MTKRHSPQQQFHEAQVIAQEHGLFVFEKRGQYQVFRRMTPHNVFIGKRSSPEGLRRLVSRITHIL